MYDKPSHNVIISAAELARGQRFGDIQWDSHGKTLAWLQKKGPDAVIMVREFDTNRYRYSQIPCGGASVNYGGGDFTIAHRQVLTVCDNELWSTGLLDGERVLIAKSEGMIASPIVSSDGKYVAYVVSGKDNDEIVVSQLIGNGASVVVCSDYEFYMQPSWHKSGEYIACVGWNSPEMPWDGSELQLICFDSDKNDLRQSNKAVLAGSKDIAVFQPIFSPDGKWIAYVSDVTGWGELYLYDIYNSESKQLTSSASEHARPAWGQGMRTLAWSSNSHAVYALRSDSAVIRLWKYGVDGTGSEVVWDSNYTDITTIDVCPNEDTVAFLASGPKIPASIVTLALNSSNDLEVITRAQDLSISSSRLSSPKPVQWTGNDASIVHGLYYRPMSESSDLPPGIIMVHGGPTGQATSSFDPKVQFFASRGYAVLEVNYRGSTGYGRNYMLEMREEWGRIDRDDLISASKFLVDEQLVDSNRIVAMGGSAGGATVLLALIHSNGLFAAGVCSYPVTDMIGLTQDTHRFERHYCHNLIGAYPAYKEIYRQRSAILYADKITDPLIVFHGSDDKVVPVEQSIGVVKSLRARDVPHEFHVFDGEGHGWRKEDTITKYFTAIEQFLDKHVKNINN